MGQMENKHWERKDREKHPLSGSLGDAEQPEEFDLDEDMIKKEREHQNNN